MRQYLTVKKYNEYGITIQDLDLLNELILRKQ